MYAVATRPTPPDSRPRLPNHARDTGIPVCRFALGQPGDNLEGRILGVRPHLRSSLCSRSLGGNPRLDAALRRRLCIALPGLATMLGGSAHAGVALEERKLPMKFSWVACQPNCRGWVSAVGIVTADSPRDFDEFARGRQLGGATIVLDSSGGLWNGRASD